VCKVRQSFQHNTDVARLPYRNNTPVLTSVLQTYQVSRISRETPAFWSHLPLTLCITKISRISGTKFGQLILSKMVKIVATRCHILKLKCPEFDFVWGPVFISSAPDPARGAQVHYSPRPPSWILGVLLIRGGKGKEDRGWKWEGSERKRGQGREKGEGRREGESAEGDRKEGR